MNARSIGPPNEGGRLPWEPANQSDTQTDNNHDSAPVTADCPCCDSPGQPVLAFDGGRGIKCDVCMSWTVCGPYWRQS